MAEEFCRYYGVTESGNFEGKNVLNRLGGIQLEPEAQQEVASSLRPARMKLLAAREQRMMPQRDDNILTSWNAMMISAYLDAYQAFGDPSYLAAAERALTFLLDYAVENGRVYRTVTAGKGRLNGYLDDAACLAAALLDAFEATSHRWYLEQAREMTDHLLERYWDEAVGGCFYTSRDHETLLHRMKSGTDSAIPSGNAIVVLVLLRLFSFTREQRYHDRAEQLFRWLHGAELDTTTGLPRSLRDKSNVPKDLRDALLAEAPLRPLTLEMHQQSKDGTRKFHLLDTKSGKMRTLAEAPKDKE